MLTLVIGLIIGGIVGACGGSVLMAALALAGAADQCAECISKNEATHAL